MSDQYELAAIEYEKLKAFAAKQQSAIITSKQVKTMKIAYKVLRIVNDRLFSPNPRMEDVYNKLKKKKSDWILVEYKLNKWNTARRDAPDTNKDLFIFKNLSDAVSYAYCGGEVVFEVEVDDIRSESLFYNNNYSPIIANTYFCTKLRLIKRLM